MEYAVLSSPARSGQRVAGDQAGGLPYAPITTEKLNDGTGIVRIIDANDPVGSGHAGVVREIKALPGAGSGGATYTLTIFGLWRVGSSVPLWLPVMLYKGAVTADMDMGAPRSTEVLDTNDRLASAITQDTTCPAAQAISVSPGTGIGPSWIQFYSKGCQYLYVHVSDAKGFVLLGGL